jgi:HemY protein
MLWSLIKILLFIAVIAALTMGAGYLVETDGGVRVAVGDFEFNLQPLQAAIALVLLVVVIWLGLKILGLLVAVLRFATGDETALSRWWNRSRERRGYEALADGLMALASGEGRVAMTKAARAERFLNRPELTDLITAQAAEISGDARKAEEVYKRLLNDERTRFVGVRGIMKQKLAKGDTGTALKLAEKAFALKPRHEETQDVLLKLQAGDGDWAGARKTLSAKLKYGRLPRAVHRRRDAVLALGEARSIVEEGRSIEARETAITANKLSPDLVPAAVMAAEAYLERGNKRYASRLLTKAWNVKPHPDLAAAFAGLEPEETAEARVKRFKSLTRGQSGEAESRMAMAEVHLANEDFSGARDAIGDLAEEMPNARTLSIMAAIEHGEGAPDSAVKGFLARAVNASRGPQWVCGNCHNIPGAWEPVCSNCGAFDTLSWREPPKQDAGALPAGAATAPLLVGQAVAETVPTVEEVVPEILENGADPEGLAVASEDHIPPEPVVAETAEADAGASDPANDDLAPDETDQPETVRS